MPKFSDRQLSPEEKRDIAAYVREASGTRNLARPILGPAARALAQLPITIDGDGYLVANDDFIEPVGSAFWERKS